MNPANSAPEPAPPPAASPSVVVLAGDCRAVLATLPAHSVHACVTSPPYWGLRDYGTPPQVWGGDPGCEHYWPAEPMPGDSPTRGQRGASSAMADRRASDAQAEGRHAPRGGFCPICGAWRGELGQEPSLDLHLANMVEVFRAVRRVLRKDGTLWLNYGDGYATAPNGRSALKAKAQGSDDRTFRDKPFDTARAARASRIKPKDRLLLPARLAIALCDDGWWVRDEVVWFKPNPMPSSIRDRTAPAHEMLYLLTPRARYFYDHVAIMEPAATRRHSGNQVARLGDSYGRPGHHVWSSIPKNAAETRRKRSVWQISTQPCPEAHFATFPTGLVEPCILAGTSARGCCPACGKPWKRLTEEVTTLEGNSARAGHLPKGKHEGRGQAATGAYDVRSGPVTSIKTLGWAQDCRCPAAEPVPATVLDPFGGTGTTGKVAAAHGRSAVLVELSPHYAALAGRDTAQATRQGLLQLVQGSQGAAP